VLIHYRAPRTSVLTALTHSREWLCHSGKERVSSQGCVTFLKDSTSRRQSSNKLKRHMGCDQELDQAGMNVRDFVLTISRRCKSLATNEGGNNESQRPDDSGRESNLDY
jgi:hypothetical protein